MSLRVTPRFWIGLLLAVVSRPCTPVHAQEVVAVLSSESSAYREALAGFEESYGHSVPVLNLSKGDIQLPNSARIFVAFGGRAASYSYPARSVLIYCLAPSVELARGTDENLRIKVRISPPPDILLAELKDIQPNLKRLTVFWIDSSLSKIFNDMEPVARTLGIELRSAHIDKAEDLPETLRSLKGKTDAMWFIPDPKLVTPNNFAMTKEFSLSNGIPFYVPVDSLVDKGATASVSSSFREMGRISGKLASQALAGTLNNGTSRVYPEKVSLTLNLTIAAQQGLKVSPDVLKKADRVLP
jgi:hypothetical protein